MKTTFLIALLLNLLNTMYSAAQNEVLGIWMIESNEAKVELYKNAQGQLEGKLMWLKQSTDESGKPRTDIKNDDKTLRTRPLIGMKLATGFVWSEEDQEWQNGTVYVPSNGNTYCGAIKLKEDGTLYLRGYICGLRFIGKTSYCTRATLDKT